MHTIILHNILKKLHINLKKVVVIGWRLWYVLCKAAIRFLYSFC